MANWRLSCVNLFLTWPRCDVSIDECYNTMDLVLGVYGIEGGIICRESHEDGEPHLHAYIKLERKCNIRNPHFLDLGDCHGNYQCAKIPKNAYEYCKKEGEFREFGNCANLEDHLKLRVQACCSELDLYDVLIESGKIHQHGFWKQYWSAYMMSVSESAEVRPLESFLVPIEITEWILDANNKALVIIGTAGYGKTEMARSVASTFGEFLWATNLQCLRSIRSDHRCIVFDDIGLESFSRGNAISILDVEQQQAIRVLYGTAVVPAGIRRIFTANSWELLVGVERARDPAIERRVRRVYINQRLYVRDEGIPGIQRAEELPMSFGNQTRK